MINLINFANCPINQYVPLIIMYSFIHSILFSILITQYYTKILEHISLYFNFVNIYKIAIFHTIITNISRIYFLVYTDIYNETSFINGFNALYLSLGMGIIVLFAHFKTFLDFESFLKDLFALAGGLAIQGLNLNSWQFNSLQILGGIFHFSVFLFLTLRLKYVERRTNPQTTPRMPFLFLKKINFFSTRHFYDLIILNLDSFHKHSIFTSLQILISPVVNTFIFLIYFKPVNSLQKKTLSILISFFVGLLLIKSSKKQRFQIINYFYGLLAVLFYTTIFLDRMRLFINYNKLYISRYFLDTLLTPLIFGFPEFLHLSYHSKRTKSSMAVCSLLNSNIMTTLCFSPLKRYFSNYREVSKYSGDQVSLSFAIISLAVTFFNYVMKNQKLSKDLGVILLFIYSLYILTYLLDYKKFIIKF